MNDLPQELDAAQRQHLAAFLDAPARPAGTLNMRELQGYLFAVAAAPQPVMPADWLPTVFGGEEDLAAGFADDAEAEAVLAALMALYNEINGQILLGEPRLPPDCQPLQPPVANFEPASPLSQWCTGMDIGHKQLRWQWVAGLPPQLEHEFDVCTIALSFFADDEELRRLAVEDAEARGKRLDEQARIIVHMLPDAITGYALLGRSASMPPEPLTEDEPLRPEKIGRNDPCPCGSGKKYKKCCGGPTLH